MRSCGTRKGQYAYGVIHTNTVEGFFSIFKRGMKGIYQQLASEHRFEVPAFNYGQIQSSWARTGVTHSLRAFESVPLLYSFFFFYSPPSFIMWSFYCALLDFYGSLKQ